MRLTTLILNAFPVSPTASAVEPLSIAELLSHCDKYYDKQALEDRIVCMRSIQGCIDGAVATDERVARNMVEEDQKNVPFSERESASPGVSAPDPAPALSRQGE